jgi:ABC-type dipeptide/oligopeptide/nickel transport system permease subunit
MGIFYELRRIRKFPSALGGLIMSCIIIIIAIAGNDLSPYSISDTTINSRVNDRLQAPGLKHPLGTDHLGTDVLSLLLNGAKYTIFIGIFTALICTVIGTLSGLVCGFFGGLPDYIIMRATDIILAFPSLLLVILIAASLGPGLSSISLALIFSGWAALARIIRSTVMSLRKEEFILAGISIGCSQSRLIFKHILPNTLPLIIVLFTMRIGIMILAEASLSFLGLGSPAGSASWGVMVSTGRSYIGTAPWCSVAPATAIAITVLAFNFLGDGLRDLLDPKLRGRL